MHGWSDDVDAIAAGVLDYARDRIRLHPIPLDGPRDPAQLDVLAGPTITASGIGGDEALRIFAEVLAPSCISTDHPRNLSFIPCAPTEAAKLFDLVVGASSIYGGSWLEGAGAVHAENEALRWLADLAGLPASSGGVFVQGGTMANLSALVTARVAHRRRSASGRRLAVIVSPEAHSSLESAAQVMDVDLIRASVGEDRRLRGDAVLAAARQGEATGREVFAVVATGGTTNLGIVDAIGSVADAVHELDCWLHVDGAYGLAGLCAAGARPLFEGIHRADSFSVDPHKWLFAPFDCAALLYRDPEIAQLAHSQHAAYLDVLDDHARWNPSDYAFQLTRRARGLPFWFSLAVHGTDRYRVAVEQTLEVARHAARAITQRDDMTLVRWPDLSVLCFTVKGWTSVDYHAWSDRLRDDGLAFVVPSSVDGHTVGRFAIVNPLTSKADIDAILATITA